MSQMAVSIAFQILAGWFVIDFITGGYHYAVDHMNADARWVRWIGMSAQVRDFQEHHDNPRSMEKFGIIMRCWLTSLFSMPALWFATIGLPYFWLSIFVGGVVCQQAHFWAHYPKRPAIARLLQQLGIFISPEAHGRHHRNFERSYGILNGWSHGFLDLVLGRLH